MTDQQNAALEPCPFCGGEARIEQRSQNQCWVECTNQDCRAMGKNCEGPIGASEAWNTRPAPAGAEAVRGALTGCMAALKSARSWFETIAEAPEDEADGFVEEAKNVVDAAYFNADCALDALAALAKAPSTGEVNAGANEIRHLKEQIRQMFITIDKQAAALATPQPAPTAAEDGLREAADSIAEAKNWIDHKTTCPCWNSNLGWKWCDCGFERLNDALTDAIDKLAVLRAKPEASTEKGE